MIGFAVGIWGGCDAGRQLLVSDRTGNRTIGKLAFACSGRIIRRLVHSVVGILPGFFELNEEKSLGKAQPASDIGGDTAQYSRGYGDWSSFWCRQRYGAMDFGLGDRSAKFPGGRGRFLAAEKRGNFFRKKFFPRSGQRRC